MFALRGLEPVAQLANKKPQCVQRLAQIVAGHSQETGLRQVGKLQLMGALLDPSFQICIRLFKLGRHEIELVAQRLEVVTRLDRDALAKLAATDAFRARPQGFDGHDHTAR
jgi:hypothetical protein